MTIGSEGVLHQAGLMGLDTDNLVEGALEGVLGSFEGVTQHRVNTRQRHLSGGGDDIASSYFASQYGNQSKSNSNSNSKHNSKHNSKANSRRNSISNKFPCSNSYVQNTMAIAAAKIAQLKMTEREEQIASYKEQMSVQKQTTVHSELNTVQSEHKVVHSEQTGSKQVYQAETNSSHGSGHVLTNGFSQSTANGATTNGATSNGATANGATTNGYMTIGNRTNGTATNEPTENGIMSFDSITNASIASGAMTNGTITSESTVHASTTTTHGTVTNGSTHMANGSQYTANGSTLTDNGFTSSANGSSILHQEAVQQRKSTTQDLKVGEVSSRNTSRRGSAAFSYLSLLPEDGSQPHRTQPIGDPQTKRTSSAAPTPDREVGRKWSMNSSMDYLNRAGKNFAVRSNPIGLAEPSGGRDGYAVGKDGSMYRSSGNLSVAGGSRAGSRAGSEAREPTNISWKERRASADVKGTGIRPGGGLVEPGGGKPPPASFCMPFGGGSNQQTRRKISKTSTHHQTSHTNVSHTSHTTNSSHSSQSSSTITSASSAEKKSSRRERNKTISGESGSAMEDLNQALRSIQKQEVDTVNVTLTRRPRAHSMPRGTTSVEESSFTVSLPGSRRTSRQSSVEPHSKKTLTRHGSVEVFDAAYNMTVPNKMARHSSQTKLEEVHADHFFFPGSVEEKVEQVVAPPPQLPQPSVKCIAVSVHKNTEEAVSNPVAKIEDSSFTNQLSSLTNQISEYTSQAQDQVQKAEVISTTALSNSRHSSETASQTKSMQSTSQSMQCSSQSMLSTSQSMQKSTINSMQTSSESMQASSESMQSSSQSTQSSGKIKQSEDTATIEYRSQKPSSQKSQQSCVVKTERTPGNKSRSRNSSGGNGTVVQGNRFNITNGLTRGSRAQSREDVNKQTIKGCNDMTAGEAMKELDSALRQYANQQQQQQVRENIQYVAKVSSKQTSRRCSVTVNSNSSNNNNNSNSSNNTNEEVINVTVSLPPSRTGSKMNSRRGSTDIGKKSSRRNSLDIYTAEYAIKMNKGGKRVDSMEQKSTFHLKVDNEDESGLNLCGRCHLPTHRTKQCTEFNDQVCPRCLSWDHWEDSCPMQDNQYACNRCDYLGHVEEVHDVSKYSQRRTCVDILGWQPFQMWFYENDFRNWWQVTGCVGVPLYRVYPRKTEWKRERPVQAEESLGVSRTDSVDDMIAQVMRQRKEYKPANSGDSSGRSSPSTKDDVSTTCSNKDDAILKPRKLRTFSETLRSLDDDILAELDVK